MATNKGGKKSAKKSYAKKGAKKSAKKYPTTHGGFGTAYKEAAR